MRRFFLIVAASVVLCGLSVGGYWAWEGRVVIIPPPGNWTVARLRRLPEEQLFFPGSMIVGRTQREGARGLEGTYYAHIGYALGTQAPSADVERFYREQLQARGWARDPYVIATTADRGVLGWRKGGLTFRLAVLRQHDPRSPPVLDQFATPYTIDIIPDPSPAP